MKSLANLYQMHTIFPKHRRKTIKTVFCFSELGSIKETNSRKLTVIMTSSVLRLIFRVSGNHIINKVMTVVQKGMRLEKLP